MFSWRKGGGGGVGGEEGEGGEWINAMFLPRDGVNLTLVNTCAIIVSLDMKAET